MAGKYLHSLSTICNRWASSQKLFVNNIFFNIHFKHCFILQPRVCLLNVFYVHTAQYTRHNLQREFHHY